MDGQNAQLNIKKHGSGMMMLLIVLVRSRNYGNASKGKYLEAKKTWLECLRNGGIVPAVIDEDLKHIVFMR